MANRSGNENERKPQDVNVYLPAVIETVIDVRKTTPRKPTVLRILGFMPVPRRREPQ